MDPIFDAASLKQIYWKLYQDHKNTYWISNDEISKIEDEQIVSRHVVKKEVHDFHDDGIITICVGTKALYLDRGRLSNYKLQNFHRIASSNFFVYNNCLYFLDGNQFTWDPMGTSGKSFLGFNEFEEGLNDPRATQIDYTKAKALTIDVLVYDHKKLFKKNEEIKVDHEINLANLKHLGILPDEFKKIIYYDIDLFIHNNDYYVINGNTLTKITRGKAALKSFKWLNEFYYIYKGTLLGYENFYYFTDNLQKN